MISASAETASVEEVAKSGRVFLTAEWRDVVMLNYAADPQLLASYVPAGTSLDSFDGVTYLSLVGFRFCRARLFGQFPIPFHSNFEEVNLRFYVRREVGGECRRGVVFIAEVVPRFAIAAMARAVYGENYRCTAMRHVIESNRGASKIQFEWKVASKLCRLSARCEGMGEHPQPGSLQEFITDHYWGYSAQRSGGCMEYRVAHVSWRVSSATEAGFEGDASALYGGPLAEVLQRPDCAFVADGSPVAVFRGTRIA